MNVGWRQSKAVATGNSRKLFTKKSAHSLKKLVDMRVLQELLINCNNGEMILVCKYPADLHVIPNVLLVRSAIFDKDFLNESIDRWPAVDVGELLLPQNEPTMANDADAVNHEPLLVLNVPHMRREEIIAEQFDKSLQILPESA